MSAVYDQMLARYEIKTRNDFYNAHHEVMQQITLAALYRSGFFENAAFYGGTCLRIFYNLNRFSEDMDFSLLKKDEQFSLENYFDAIISEFSAHGRDVMITKKVKSNPTNVESAFLKDNTKFYKIQFRNERSIKIKLEVDTDPPSGFKTEYKLLLLPFSFMTQCYTLPALFAGKLHAFLFRNWKNRVKGRDWYDLEWYIRNDYSLDFNHFKKRCKQGNYLDVSHLTHKQLIEMLKEHITKTNIKQVLDDARPFVKNTDELKIWSTDYFLKLVDFIKFE